ncbi:MAG: hypothetical protein JRJ26_17550 [Deltaproteobacteria bacterium]|nr:hypothetical protein [Deltaproteobacteria bacterium]
MKEHWVFIDGRESNPMICSRMGIKIYFMDHDDHGPRLETRVPGLLILYDTERDRFKVVRLNNRTGIEVEGVEHFRSKFIK